MAVPWTTRAPRAWAEWEITLWGKVLSMRGVGEAGSKNLEKCQDGDFYVTSGARAGCELAY